MDWIEKLPGNLFFQSNSQTVFQAITHYHPPTSKQTFRAYKYVVRPIYLYRYVLLYILTFSYSLGISHIQKERRLSLKYINGSRNMIIYRYSTQVIWGDTLVCSIATQYAMQYSKLAHILYILIIIHKYSNFVCIITCISSHKYNNTTGLYERSPLHNDYQYQVGTRWIASPLVDDVREESRSRSTRLAFEAAGGRSLPSTSFTK